MSEISLPESVASVAENQPRSLSEEPAQDRERVLTALQEKGFIERSARGNIIADLDKFRGANWREVNPSRRLGDRYPTLVESFKGLEVTSKEDWADYLRERDQGKQVELPKKPLYYSPRTREEALSPDKIRQADFYLGPWQASRQRSEKYPGLEATDLSFDEVAMAVMIYHPKFGGGQREENGQLYVKLPSSGERRPISSEFFKKEMGFLGTGNTQVLSLSQPRAFVDQMLPHLLEGDLLRPEDFRITSTAATAERYRVEKNVSPSGTVMFNRLIHWTGSKEFKGMKVFQLAPELGAVVTENEGNLELRGTFQIVNKPELPLGSYVGTSETQPKPFTPGKDPETSLEQIAANFSRFLTTSNSLSTEYGINLAGLNLYEQLQAVEVHQQLKGRSEFKEFTRKNGEVGLKTLISLSGSPEKVQALFRLGKDPRSGQIFGQYNDLRELASAFATSVSGQDLAKTGEVYQAILTRAEQILLADVDKIGQKTADKIKLLGSYSSRVEEFLRTKYGYSPLEGKEKTLEQLEKQKDPNIVGYLSTGFEEIFRQEMSGQVHLSAGAEVGNTANFYEKTGERLYAEASETTGDTDLERQRLDRFFGGFNIQGTVLDAGSADGERITSFMAQRHPEIKFVGLDLNPGNEHSAGEQAEFVKGSFTHVPLADASVDALFSVWSPINDITRREDQLAFIKEFSRVVKNGGYLYLDVPYLSAQFKGSWYQQATEYASSHDAPFGMIEADFQTEGGGLTSKEFYIYLSSELNKLLGDAGFEMLNKVSEEHLDRALEVEEDLNSPQAVESQKAQVSPILNPVWVTKAGKPRLTIVARKSGKLGTNLDLIT